MVYLFSINSRFSCTSCVHRVEYRRQKCIRDQNKQRSPVCLRKLSQFLNSGIVALHSSIIHNMSKREGSPPNEGALIKRARGSTPPSLQIAISSTGDDGKKGLIRTVQRTSGLEAPIVSLAGSHSVRGFVSLYLKRAVCSMNLGRGK